jgi:MFS family permease
MNSRSKLMTPFSAASMETRMLRVYWNDGLLDLLVGAALLLLGIAWRYDLVALGPIAPALLVSLWKPIRAKWIDPRIGYVEFTESRERETRRFLVSTLLLGGVMLMLGVSMYFFVIGRETPPVHMVAGLPAILLSVLAFLTAMVTRLIRLGVYGLLLLLSGIGVVASDARPEAAMLASGVVIFITGIVLLTRFFRTTSQFNEESGEEG